MSTHIHTGKQTETETERERDRERMIEKQRWAEKDTERNRERQRERGGDRERMREKQRWTERVTERNREGQRDIERQKRIIYYDNGDDNLYGVVPHGIVCSKGAFTDTTHKISESIFVLLGKNISRQTATRIHEQKA